ncbi:hypothetical protein ACFYY8_41095 [Streptosporangium sp. NPDC001559]|uniref:hypothetical protein n=1 Tax=Streptosporangium sp. NPDC001559 TaxID=3366187 RepID=UPI0036EB205D
MRSFATGGGLPRRPLTTVTTAVTTAVTRALVTGTGWVVYRVLPRLGRRGGPENGGM